MWLSPDVLHPKLCLLLLFLLGHPLVRMGAGHSNWHLSHILDALLHIIYAPFYYFIIAS